MKVAWNTTLLDKNLSGIGYYIVNTLKNIKKINSNIKIKAFGGTGYNYKNINMQKDLISCSSKITKNRNLRVLWEQFILPNLVNKNDVDILHCPDHVIPLIPVVRSFKTVVTVHDLAIKLYPETFDWKKRIYARLFHPQSFKKADKIIAVSENTKNDLRQTYNIPAEKIKVIYNGVDEQFKVIKNTKKLNRTKEKYNLPDNFILYLGTIEPRKNIKNLIKAYELLITEENIKDIKLVIAGGRGWLYNEIFKLVKQKSLKNNVIFTGYINNEDIVSLYNLALVFIYPSLYEGFGLPPLEAMACGTPVISSSISSLPEVVGKAAITVNPKNIKEIKEALINIINDKKLQRYLIKKGLYRVKKFTWEKTAKETLKVYYKLAGQV